MTINSENPNAWFTQPIPQSTWGSPLIPVNDISQILYDGQEKPLKYNNCGGCGQRNDSGSGNFPGWQDPDAYEAKAIADCCDNYKVACKNNGRIGQSKKWKDCKTAARAKAQEIRENNAKLQYKATSEMQMNDVLTSLTNDATSGGASLGSSGAGGSNMALYGGLAAFAFIGLIIFLASRKKTAVAVAAPVASASSSK